MKVAIKYCGGCNPFYDRVALVRRIKTRLAGRVEFVAAGHEQIDLVLAVEGCKTACADLSHFDGKKIRVITYPEDAEEFFQEILLNLWYWQEMPRLKAFLLQSIAINQRLKFLDIRVAKY